MKGSIFMNAEKKKNNQITVHPRERLDLNEFFALLTYRCNAQCNFCIESRVHENKFLSHEDFVRALIFAKEHDLPNFFLHGGEPTVHPNIVNFAKMAKGEAFKVQMFTNGINFNKLRELDGIVDEINISYRGKQSLRFRQSEWTSHLSLQVLVTESSFPTLNELIEFVQYARETTGMIVDVNTLNPVNQDAYNDQYVSYLEEMFLELPDDAIFCTSNKATFELNGTNVRLGNKNLNPGHIKYSMSPDGVIHDRFARKLDLIKKDSYMESQLMKSQEKVQRLREVIF